MKMEKTTADKIIFLRDWISKNVTTENLERLLYGLEYENVLQVDRYTGRNLSRPLR